MDLFKIGSVAIMFGLLLLFYNIYTSANLWQYAVALASLGFGIYGVTRPPTQ